TPALLAVWAYVVLQDVRKVVQVLEQTAREILTVLQSVHQPSGFKESDKCAKAKELFCTVRTQLGALKNKFPSRLAVNSVTAGDYGRPLRISNELDSGFRLLNLKNDPLRKRYDGLKYDVEKIEVVYDLSIRGLTKEQEAGGNK
uniref:Translin n=1 Tax=Oncorhynchus kisutch TaxID=8019 RepID=A0A8C7FKN1_ONCKI